MTERQHPPSTAEEAAAAGQPLRSRVPEEPRRDTFVRVEKSWEGVLSEILEVPRKSGCQGRRKEVSDAHASVRGPAVLLEGPRWSNLTGEGGGSMNLKEEGSPGQREPTACAATLRRPQCSSSICLRGRPRECAVCRALRARQRCSVEEGGLTSRARCAMPGNPGRRDEGGESPEGTRWKVEGPKEGGKEEACWPGSS